LSRPATCRPLLLLASALATIGAACGMAGPERAAAPASPAPGVHAVGPGPSVGETLPPFEAPDQTGRVWTLESLRGPRGLVLNVNRSVVW
jgi:hypothetical protein